MRRPPVLLDHHTPSSGLQQSRLVERAFGLGPCALTEVMALLQNRLANAEA